MEPAAVEGTDPLHGVVVGAGDFAGYHADAWNRLPGVRITAVCDLDPISADDLAQRAGISARFTDWREMLDAQRPDFVDVVTPADTHPEIVRYAARHGIHVICQKPPAPTLEEAAALVDDLLDAPTRFMVHANWRWQPWYRTMRSLIDEGAIGDVSSLSFQMRTGESWDTDAYLGRTDVSADAPRLLLAEMGANFFDTFRYLMGEVTSVYARLHRHNAELRGEDAAIVVLGFAKGQTAVLDASRYNESSAADPMLTFGTMRIDGSEGHLLLQADGNVWLHPLGGIPELIVVDIPELGFAGDCVLATQRHFVECLRAGRPFESEGDRYLPSMRVVEAAYESARLGHVVALD